jgi:hypothetical protein
MRLLIALVICFALLWVADIFLFKSRYSSQLWRDVQYQAQKINGDVRRLDKVLIAGSSATSA